MQGECTEMAISSRFLRVNMRVAVLLATVADRGFLRDAALVAAGEDQQSERYF